MIFLSESSIQLNQSVVHMRKFILQRARIEGGECLEAHKCSAVAEMRALLHTMLYGLLAVASGQRVV